MKLGTFLEMYGNWNGKALINDNSMNKIVQDRTINIYEQRKDLLERTVLTFNFYNGIIIIIISDWYFSRCYNRRNFYEKQVYNYNGLYYLCIFYRKNRY